MPVTTSTAAITFAPLLPWPVIAALAALAAAILALCLWRRARGALLRGAVFALGLLALANPVATREERQPLNDVALVAVDRSPSQGIGDRPAQTDATLEAVRAAAADLDGLELREVEVAGDGRGGTRLFREVGQALAEIDRERLAGILVISDGQVHDAPGGLDALGVDAPLHLLLTGAEGEYDRRLAVDEVPTYGMVGEEQQLVVRVDELPAASGAGRVPVLVRQDGRIIHRLDLVPGQPQPVPFRLERAGQTVLEVEAETAEGELTALNNRAAFFVNGVRDRLRVLLVSGQPYPGLRVWRNLLKAVPSVDLVHFTILRPPEKQDGTPIRELALIAFPSRELFEVKLNEFDLVIFDRYSRRGLLPMAYLDNVARYVEEGGALLEAAGPEFAHPLSLYRTPLSRVLPARPSGAVLERGFAPELSELGRRHPVTAGLVPEEAADEEEDPAWGRWFRQVDVEVGDAEVLMNGATERPLLVLDRVGEGRVAQLLSDHAWLWARGYEGGGPQSLLLRRLVHWLMKEPELEEEDLLAEPRGDRIEVLRRTLDDDAAATVTLNAPSGAVTTLELREAGPGVATGAIEAAEMGLYRISDGTRTTYANVRPIGAEELADMRSTDEMMRPLVEASGGGVARLSDGLPDLRPVAAGRATTGRNWLGLRLNDRYLVTGASQLPLLPALLALALLLASLTFAWYREGR
ncbi:MAG TPA: hypothetical protein VFG47_11490 [Geminicoccaceae bacterium]|nr:hypothetical protein [Geminicoccaceae bacterium]